MKTFYIISAEFAIWTFIEFISFQNYIYFFSIRNPSRSPKHRTEGMKESQTISSRHIELESLRKNDVNEKRERHLNM